MLKYTSHFQVKKVFDTLAPAVGLSVGLAVGQSSVAAEAAELVQISSKMVHSFGSDGPCDKLDVESCIDILVATPGRLMDHLRSTSGFTIEHLQYLVCISNPVSDRMKFLNTKLLALRFRVFFQYPWIHS